MSHTTIMLRTLAPTLVCICLSSLQTVRADGIHYDELERGNLATHDRLVSSSSHGHNSHWTFRDHAPTASSTTFDVTYFVHSHNGMAALTSAQLDRIADAAAVWNAAGAKVELSEVESNAAADIHVHGAPTSACGSGGLGCAQFSWFSPHDSYADGHLHHEMRSQSAAEGGTQNMTMIVSGSFDWYTGASAAGIGFSEYDYMSVAIQEFGHHLGLGHNSGSSGHGSEPSSSPMNGALPNGTTRRVLQPSDLAAIQHVWGLGSSVPEPSSLTLLAGCLAMFGVRRWRKRRARN